MSERVVRACVCLGSVVVQLTHTHTNTQHAYMCGCVCLGGVVVQLTHTHTNTQHAYMCGMAPSSGGKVLLFFKSQNYSTKQLGLSGFDLLSIE